MSIQPINSASVVFTGKDKQTEKGNTYQTSNIARNTGIAAGVISSGILMYTQVKSLKTIQGKRNLISGFHDRGKSLNDVMKRTVKRDNNGKIIPLEPGQVNDRTKAVVKSFKTTLAVWGAGITAATGLFGKLIDTNINASRAEKADLNRVRK